jgi:hypothetical protein
MVSANVDASRVGYVRIFKSTERTNNDVPIASATVFVGTESSEADAECATRPQEKEILSARKLSAIVDSGSNQVWRRYK